ncbi:hypothetical protein ANO11243_039640 [Dothideomycetidae sp. 11243]|nr:hypothetical protein ANO11243_039640 [fungal sp. No.11243]
MSEVLNNAHTGILALVDLHDYDKFIDIYDIPREGIEQSVSVQAVDASDLESSGVLRVMGWRVSILRRAVLCSLLSLEADGDARDYSRWRSAADRMNKLCKETKINAGRILESLESLEDLALPSTPTPSSKPTNERLRTQVRKISNLSSGIKALQAKMTLLREESNVAISRADDLTDLGPSLMSQYESIGADIQTLLREWESGKAALSANIVKHERRISLATSPIIRSPGLSSTFGVLSELSSVGEGGPADALVSLSGDTSLSQRESSSPRSSMPATPSDEEIFEAIALPKRRNSLSREDRIRLMNEERVKAEERKSQRESGLNMIRELRSVINLRKKPDQAPDTDVPSN